MGVDDSAGTDLTELIEEDFRIEAHDFVGEF
jgi:hypothetical protein